MKKIVTIAGALCIAVPFLVGTPGFSYDYYRNSYQRPSENNIYLTLYLFRGGTMGTYDNLMDDYALDTTGVANYQYSFGSSGLGIDWVLADRFVLHGIFTYSYLWNTGPMGEAGISVILYNFERYDINIRRWFSLGGGVMLHRLSHTNTHNKYPNRGTFRDTIIYGGLEMQLRDSKDWWFDLRCAVYYLHGFVNRTERQTFIYTGQMLRQSFPSSTDGFLIRCYFFCMFFSAGMYEGQLIGDFGAYVPINF